MGWVYGKLSVVVGLLFLATFSFKLEMGLKWNFGMMSGMGIILWVCVFQIYSESVMIRRLMWLISCSFLTGFFFGTSNSCEKFMIGNQILSVFWNVIYGVSLRGIGDDKMCWTLVKSKGFEVSSYYQALLGVCTQSFPWRSIWKQKVPSRVAFFVWTATLGMILTIDNLCRKKVRPYFTTLSYCL